MEGEPHEGARDLPVGPTGYMLRTPLTLRGRPRVGGVVRRRTADRLGGGR